MKRTQRKTYSRKAQELIKRFSDILFSLAGILLLAPLWLLIGIGVRGNISGSVLFRQKRTGWKNRPFQILKFRTMHKDPSAEAECDGEEDPGRTPPFGRWLRRTKLDEAPQLINVLFGNMSLVGPRPYVETQSAPLDPERLIMRPGMTGLAQVYGNSSLRWEERTQYDLYYHSHFSLRLDIWILLQTGKVLLFGESRCVKHFEDFLKENP